jgi:riboflavin kinase/FMN adenylyltransferase
VDIQFFLAEGRDRQAPPVAMTIGSFDGVHRGHQRLLEHTTAAARALDGIAVAVTFEPHPRAVLDPGHAPQSITTLDEKRDRLAAAGLDRLVVIGFSREVSQWNAENFCDRLLAGFDVRDLVIGPDFALGHHRQGDLRFLEAYGADHGFTATAVAPVLDEAERISSTRIRSALVSGEVEPANRLLGYPYFLDGTVEHGNHVGRRLGFPTANLSIAANKCLPAGGIYTTWLRVGDRWHVAAASIGYRPTFGGDRLTVEAHILDFDADIYGERVRLAFVQRLREERNYPDEASLIAQIGDDVAETRRRLSSAEAPAGL